MNKKKIICFLSALLFTCFFKVLPTHSYADVGGNVPNSHSTNNLSIIKDDLLSEKFKLKSNPIGSEWHYVNDEGGNLFLVLSNIKKTNDITNCVTFRGAYSKSELFSINEETLYFEIEFSLYKDSIMQKVWDSKSNSSTNTLIESLEDLSFKKIYLNINQKPSTFSLKCIRVPDKSVLENIISDEMCKNYMIGEKILFSKQNDISMEWYRSIDDLDDEYYSNGAHHTILMMLDWLYSNKQDFKHRPIYMFGENDMLTDESLKNAIDVYSEYSIYTSSNITEELITHNLNNGYIIILKLNPMDITHETNLKSHKGIYYYDKEHYIIIKGFAQIDTSLHYTVYDPFSFHEKYEDGTFKGKDRFYKASNILDTINSTKSDVYVIKKPKTY